MSKIKKYLLLILIIALFGEIYFYPFESELKFSAGVIIFNLSILIVEDVSELTLAFLCGIGVFILSRSIQLSVSYVIPSYFDLRLKFTVI